MALVCCSMFWINCAWCERIIAVCEVVVLLTIVEM